MTTEIDLQKKKIIIQLAENRESEMLIISIWF